MVFLTVSQQQYFIWVLYFDQIEHDRFGTIRQQIWTILHFPLHMAILLTVEGSTTLILWNIIIRNVSWLQYWWVVDTDFKQQGFNSTAQVAEWLTNVIETFSAGFKDENLLDYYDWQAQIAAIENITAPFGSPEYNNETGTITDGMLNGLMNFVFHNFNIELPETHGDVQEASHGSEQTFFSYVYIFLDAFIYYFIASGVFLLVLAVMYWFGKVHKSRGEYISIFVRVLIGIGLGLTSLIIWEPNNADLYGILAYLESAWVMPTIMFSFFFVIVLDNLLVWHSNKTLAKLNSSDNDDSNNNNNSDDAGDENSNRRESTATAGEDENAITTYDAVNPKAYGQAYAAYEGKHWVRAAPAVTALPILPDMQEV